MRSSESSLFDNVQGFTLSLIPVVRSAPCGYGGDDGDGGKGSDVTADDTSLDEVVVLNTPRAQTAGQVPTGGQSLK